MPYNTFKYVNFANKRIVPYSNWSAMDSFYRAALGESVSHIFDSELILGTGLTLSSSGADVVSIGGSGIGCDGDGFFMNPFDESYYQDLSFENANTIPYYIGMQKAFYPSGIVINPRTGYPEYEYWMETIGLKATPNSVTDNGNGTITFVVNSILESGVDHSGREVTVWMNSPAKNGTTESIAIQTLTVSYSGGNNQITTAADKLGQITVDTTAANYSVCLRGPRIERNTDLRGVSNVAFIGIVTGNGGTPTSFDTSDQRVIPYSWATALLDGLPGDLYPDTDNTYDLGKPTKRWANAYVVNFSISGDFLPQVDNTQDLGSSLLRWKNLYVAGVGTDLIPTTDDTYDLGSASYEWQNLYVDGVAYIDTLSVSTAVGEGCASTFIPAADDTYDLGVAGYEWRNARIDGIASIDALQLSVTAGEGCDSSLIPTTDDTYNLGGSSYEWQNLYVDGIAYIDTLNLANSAGLGSYDIVPIADDSYGLGNSSYRWQFARIRNLYVTSDTAGDGVMGALVPGINNASDLGSTSYQYKDMYINGVAYLDKVEVDSSTTEGFQSTIKPTADDTYDVGTSSYAWRRVYVHDLYYKTQQTFDNYDDLALIEACEPSDVFSKQIKGGKTRDVQHVNVNTIPWPMLGRLDPTNGNHYLDLGDSTMFLLGAIKQLYSKHKAALERIAVLENLVEAV